MVDQVNAPFGFQLYTTDDGAPEALVECYSSDSTILGLGDAVVLAGSYAGTGQPNPGRPTVTRASAGDTNKIFGIVERIDQYRVEDSNFSLSRRHKPASVGMYIGVRRARPGDTYKIQADGAVPVASVGQVGNLATITDANTSTGLSTMQLSASSLTTGQVGYQLVVVGFPEDAYATYNTAYQEVLVKINNPQIGSAFGGV